jgi:hypothetical protein
MSDRPVNRPPRKLQDLSEQSRPAAPPQQSAAPPRGTG